MSKLNLLAGSDPDSYVPAPAINAVVSLLAIEQNVGIPDKGPLARLPPAFSV
jgi:hypothetical protein